MNQLIKVSIVIAIYKSEPFLEKLLNSVKNQTYKNIEVILVDDGSPDKSGYLCDLYSKNDDRFLVIHKLNGGACEARNVGMKVATGEYITIIDGDDWLEKDYVEYLLQLALDANADMSMTDQIFTTRDRIQTQNKKIEIWTSEKAAASIIYPFVPIGPWNKLYKLDLIRINNLSFSVPWSGEGLYFSFMAAQYSNQVAVGHRKIYNYRLNNTGSGLTSYNVQMGLNACYNIKNSIGKNNLNNSKIIDNAIQWHIWKNYNYLLFLIIATNTQKGQYSKEYKDCILNIRRLLIKTVIQSKIGINKKIKMIIQGIFPRTWAKRRLKIEKKELKKDTMN